ncbi:hypothetical protein [Nitratireductor soli]|uniref:hypothetical protein n=1 Tax=Nitratireductor soli TaxID=1670619 RepID=UPI00069E20E7|nr:hypothetical protein [Nitratireductor soli]
MVIFSAIVAVGAFLFSGTLLAQIALGALAFGLKLGLAYLNRPKKRPYSAVQGEVMMGGDVPVTTLYGIGKMAGHRVDYFRWGSGNKYNADVFVLANGWCDGLEDEIYFYGEKHGLVPRPIIGNEVEHWGVSGYGDDISIRFYDGRPGQGPDMKLVNDSQGTGRAWKESSTLSGMAYVVVERLFNETRNAKGRPYFEFVVRGLRLYDPRQDSTLAGGTGTHRLDDPATWAFSLNPGVQRLNYQIGLRGRISSRTLIGEGKSLGQLDLGSYFAAMNVCDTPREGKPRYQSSLFVTGEDDHTEVLKEFDDAMAGYAMNRRGLSGVIAGAPQVPVVTITADDIPDGRAQDLRRRKNTYELFNHISGQFISPENHWKPESLKPVHVNADVAADGRTRQTSNDFLQVTDPDIAQYLLSIRYRQQRLGGQATVPVSRRVGFRVLEGEWVNFDGRTWLVTGWRCDDSLRVTLTLAQTSAAIYAEGGIEPGPIVIPAPPPINPNLLSNVIDFNVEVGVIEGGDGTEEPALRFTWAPPEDPTITDVIFEYFVGGDPTGQTIYSDRTDKPEAGEYVTSKDVIGGVFFSARCTIRTVPDRFKTHSPWKTALDMTGPVRVYPPNVEGLGEDVQELLKWAGLSDRSIWEELERLGQLVSDQNSWNFFDKQSLRTELTAVNSALTASYTLAIQTAVGTMADDLLAVTTKVETLEVAVADTQTGLSGLGQIVNAQDTRITQAEGQIAVNSSSVQALTSVVNEVSAEALFRAQTVAGPGDGWSRIVLQTRVSTSVGFASAALFLDAKSNGEGRIVLDAQNLFFGDLSSGSTVNPLVYSNGEWALENLRLGTLNFNRLQSNNGKLDIRGDGTNAYLDIFN